MYELLIDPEEVKPKSILRRKRPIVGYESTILLKPGSSVALLPPGTEIRRIHNGMWEAHLPIKNKKIVKNIAIRLDAVGFL